MTATLIVRGMLVGGLLIALLRQWATNHGNSHPIELGVNGTPRR